MHLSLCDEGVLKLISKIVFAIESDIPEILRFVRSLAQYEKLEQEMVATEFDLRRTLFGAQKYAEVLFLREGSENVGFALFFHNYSTFLGRPGIYLEDLFVLPEHRGKGYGKRLLTFLAKLAVERGCGRFEWSVLDWNKPSIDFYLSLGARSMREWIPQRVTGPALLELAGQSVD